MEVARLFRLLMSADYRDAVCIHSQHLLVPLMETTSWTVRADANYEADILVMST